jgi:hypothetical protein
MEPIKWNDEKIEQLLKNLPPIRDRRSKQDLYLKVQANINYKQTKGKRIPSWGLPAIATACALVLFGIFVPDLMKPGIKMENSSYKISQSGSKESSDKFNNSSDQADSRVSLKAVTSSVNYHGPLLAKDFTHSNKDWVTVAYMDDQAQVVIPVSFVTEKGNYLDKVNEQLSKFKPEAAGLQQSPLNQAKLSEEEEMVIIDWPPGAIYEGEEGLLQSLISYTFANENQKSKVQFKTNGQLGYEFSLMGPKEDMDLNVPHTPYFRFDTPTTDTFIVSLFSAGLDAGNMPKSFEAALDVMDDEQERGLKPLLPKNLKLHVKLIGDDSVEVSFPDSYKLSADDKENLMMIDGILLTAESYGYDRVKFNIAGSDSVGPYDLDEPIEDVTGINFYQ